jgi:hypothetical protein
VALVEHEDGRQQRFRFAHNLKDYDRLVAFLVPEPSFREQAGCASCDG